jgi:hypothetical protein
MPNSDEDQQFATRLIANACAFRLAAQHIANNPSTAPDGQSVQNWPAFYTNIGFAIELALKAYLAIHGWEERRLRNEVKHDLGIALCKARLEGLADPGENVKQIVQEISRYHRDRSFVYLGRVDVSCLPDFPEAIEASCQLLEMVRAAIPGPNV